MPVQTAIQVRRGTASSWTSTNPTLAAGEIGFETDTSKFKIGTGSTAWNSLNYFVQDPVTTKGDLYTFSTTDTRLAVGNNGETLVADSSTSTGLRWQSAYNGNWVINGGLDWWQRGTSFSTPAGTYTADRWCATRGGSTVNYTVSRQTSFLTSSQYSIRLQRNSGQTSTEALFLGMAWESQDVVRWQGKTMTWSFWARSGADFSPNPDAINVSFETGTGTDQGPFVQHTGAVVLISQSQTITTTGTRYSYTFTIPSNATSARWNINFTPVGTAGTNDWFEITNMQLEFGSVATEFKRSGVTLAGERSACERYYCRFDAGSSNYVPLTPLGLATATTSVNNTFQFPVTMRVAPSGVDGANLSVYGAASGGSAGFLAVSAIALTRASTNIAELTSTVTGASLGGTYRIQPNNAAGYVAFSAEL